MKVLICGDRNWGKNNDERELIKEYVNSLPQDSVIIEGECRGADYLSRIYAEARELKVMKFPADWKKHGKAAGPIRNSLMLKELTKDDLVVAFHNDIETSRGTKDTMTKAKKLGIKVILMSTKST